MTKVVYNLWNTEICHLALGQRVELETPFTKYSAVRLKMTIEINPFFFNKEGGKRAHESLDGSSSSSPEDLPIQNALPSLIHDLKSQVSMALFSLQTGRQQLSFARKTGSAVVPRQYGL